MSREDAYKRYLRSPEGKRRTMTAKRAIDDRGSGGSARSGAVDVPGQQFGDTVDRMVGDAAEDIAQVVFGVEAIEFRGLDQRVHRGGPFATGIRSGKNPILSAKGQIARSAALFEISRRPSLRYPVSACQRDRA